MDTTVETTLLGLQATIEKQQFEIEKAEFNDNPTDELEQELQTLQYELVTQLTTYLSTIVPEQLPPLEVNNPRPYIDEDINSGIIDLIENLGLEEDDDSDLLFQLDVTKESHQSLILLLGSWYIHQQQPDQATGYYQELLEHNPSDLVYYNLSYALAVQKVLKPALDYLSNISNDFDQALLYLNRAVIYDRLGRFDEANVAFETASNDRDYQAKVWINWGLSAAGFGKTDMAKSLLKKVLSIDSNYPGLYFQLGQVAATQGLYSEAIDSFSIAHREEPDNLEILSDLATACLMAKKYHDAIDYYKQYLEVDRSLAVLNNLGAAYLQTHQYEEALVVLDQALEINPNHRQSIKNRDVALTYLDRS